MTAQTSEHGGWIRGQLEQLDGAGDPVASANARVLINNGLHALDQSGQVLVNMAALAADDIQAPTALTTFQLVRNLDLVVPVRIRHGDASTFRVVVYMRCLASAASTATFRLSLRPLGPETRTIPEDPASFPTTHIAEVSTTSTSGVDKTATLYLPTSRLTPQARQSTDGEGDPMSGEELELSLQVWAKSSGAGIPRVYVFTAREFAGDR